MSLNTHGMTGAHTTGIALPNSRHTTYTVLGNIYTQLHIHLLLERELSVLVYVLNCYISLPLTNEPAVGADSEYSWDSERTTPK